MARYFEGRKHIRSFTQRTRNSRLKFQWDIYEEWRDINEGTTARCDQAGEIVLSSTKGIDQKAINTLKTLASASIGNENIFGLKAEIEKTQSIELGWHAESTVENRFSIKSPKCGIAELTIYQLFHIYTVTTLRRHWFPINNTQWRVMGSKTFIEGKHFHDGLHDYVKYDPSCKCPQTDTDRDWDGIIGVDMGPASLRAPFMVNDDKLHIQIFPHDIQIEILDLVAFDQNIEKGMEIRFPAAVLPEPLLFLHSIPNNVVVRGVMYRISETVIDRVVNDDFDGQSYLDPVYIETSLEDYLKGPDKIETIRTLVAVPGSLP